MENFDIAQDALKVSLGADGSATKELDKWQKSLDAKLLKLQASWQNFAQTFMDSDFLKGAVDALIALVDILEKLIDNFGILGTLGMGIAGKGIFNFFKGNNKNLFGSLVEGAVDGADAIKNIAEAAADGTKAAGKMGEAAGKSAGKIIDFAKATGNGAEATGELAKQVVKTGGGFKAFITSAAGITTAIGATIAVVALLYNHIKNVKEEASKARQEAIKASDDVLSATTDFEKAYIKYSDKTELTASEEAELESAINGAINALGDKSEEIENLINKNKEYIDILEEVKIAELKAAKEAADTKVENAQKELEETVKGWFSLDGSEVDVGISLGDDPDSSEVAKIAKKVGEKYYKNSLTFTDILSGTTTNTASFELAPDATIDEIVDYYNMLVEYKGLLEDAELENTAAYKSTDEAIQKMTSSIETYASGVYEAAKAQYQLDNNFAIPKTLEDYMKMRESILSSSEVSKLSTEQKFTIGTTLDSEYRDVFDLSEPIAQARSFVGIIKDYGDTEAKNVESFINMRTAVNNNECSVGDYLSKFKEIEEMTGKWSDAEKENFNLSLGLDTDSIKEQYDEVYNYISRTYLDKLDTTGMSTNEAENFKNKRIAEVKELLNDLNASELAAVVNIKGEIDWENTSNDEILKQIQKEADIIDAMGFQADIEIDTTALETLNKILEESASAMGLSSDAIDSLNAKYKDLDGFNPDTLFEKTTSGIKVNREELVKLEKKYNDLTKTEVEDHIKSLTDAYNENVVAIDKCSNASERAQLISENETYKAKIEELAIYQSQLEGVTGAYQRWIDAQAGPEDYDGYEAVATGREDVEDEINRGFIGNATKEYIDLLSGKDLQGGTIDDYAEAWEKLDDKVTGAGYSIQDFFTVNDDGDITSKGIDRFFKSLQTDFKGSIAKFNEETKKWEYDFSQENLEKIQKEWGMGIEAIELMLEAAVAAGYDVDWGGILDGIDLDTSEFESLVNVAKLAQSELNKIKGYENISFNFATTNVADATSEIERARKAFSNFINEDGTVNLKAEGAEEMQFILSTLIIQKQQLSTPAIMKVDTSQIDETKSKVAEVIQAAQTLQSAYENYEIAIATGVDVEGAKKDLNAAISTLEGTDASIRASLKLPTNEELQAASSGLGNIKVGASLDGTAIGNIETKIQTECTPEVIAKVTGIDESVINDTEGGRQIKYTAEHSDVDNFLKSLKDINKKITYTYGTAGTKPNPKNIERTITYTYEYEGTGPAAGTAHAGGTTGGRAFARGNWGIKGNGIALGGELGQELVVRDGRFFTIGDNGAQFFRYRKNDIVFNAAQTASLFKYGGIKGANPRGKMLATGTAFAEGSYPSSGKAFASATAKESDWASKRVTVGTNKVTGNKYTKSKDKDSEPSEETLDWIETKLARIQRAIDKLDQKASNVYKSWSSRNSALKSEITEVRKEISAQQSAYDKYMQAANAVGLSSSWAKKVRDGSISISTITDDALKEKISDYTEWYNKAIECKDAIEELKKQESELYAQRVKNAGAKYDGVLGVNEYKKNMLEERISQSEAQGWLVSEKYYKAIRSNENARIKQLKNQRDAMKSELTSAMKSGTIQAYSEGWYELTNQIDEVNLAIEQSNTQIKELDQTIQQLKWEQFDILQDRISSVAEEADFLIELLSSDKLYDDKGNLTNEGMSVAGLHGTNYETYMRQSELAGKEAARLKKELAKDPYDTDLEERYREMVKLQQDYILSAQNEKEAIRDLVEEGISLELDALDELIKKKNEALDAEKDLYEYQKKVEEQTKNIASLEKQLAAYAGDDSEEAAQKIQQIKVSLDEERESLRETEYDKWVSDTSAMLDSLAIEYESLLNQRLDNIDYLIADMTAQANNNASTIVSTIDLATKDVGYELSTSMDLIWGKNTASTNSVLTTYGDRTNASLDAIKNNLTSIVNSLNSKANTSTPSVSEDSKYNTTGTYKNPASSGSGSSSGGGSSSSGKSYPYGKASSTTGIIGQGATGNKVKAIQYALNQLGYGNSGTTSLDGKYGSGTASAVRAFQKATGASPDGIVGDETRSKFRAKGYASGKEKLLSDELAWTQEKGRELIVRPSDGAILTPVAKGDSVLNATATGNIWNMANNPAEFIKNNLNLGSSGVPNNSSTSSNTVQNFENISFNLPNVKNYDELLSAMQKDKNFQRLIDSLTITKMTGGSSLAKNKSIR